jgi:ABC-type multidrug transport system ATPase subunit
MKLVANNLGKRFNREWIFRNFNYTFSEGNTYAITGPNGSGKSTLIQVLCGQMHLSEGSIQYSINDQSEIYKSVAIAAPYMDLIEEFTLEEMIQFHFKFKTTRQPIETILEKSGLNSSRKKTIASFSSGMRQRLKLVLVFYSEADLLFLDEPCTNLDKTSIEWYQNQLSLLPRSVSIFIASNQEHEYPITSDRINILSYK